MKKFLVPTDFSDTAKNAARYAVEFAATDPDVLIILYNVFDKIAAGSDGSLLTETDDDRKKILNQALAQLEIELHEISSVRIQYVAEEGGSLVDNIERYIRHNGIDIVIMGITGATKLEQIFIGSNALNMAREGVCPVIIVPPNARFNKIKNVMLASDFKDVKTTTPVAQIQLVLDIFKPNLHIVNVDSEHYVELTEEFRTEKTWLEKRFADYNPQFYFIRMFDFLDAISSFVADHQIDLIVTVPRKHSFVRGLYKTSHTKKLAYHSHVPVVAIHE
ncbi:MAG: universal stress protein [Chitinophagaceae bacterium]|nr:universal stress protein [Chitinophagaceae bacterium]